MRLLDRTLFHPSPGRGTLARSHSYYTRRGGAEKLRMDQTVTIDDNIHTLQRAFSLDHGRTWSAAEPLKVKEPVPGGLRRWHVYSGFVDVRSDRLVTMVMEGVLPVDEPFAAIPHWTLSYRVSVDGGHTTAVDEPVVGAGHSPDNPFDGVWTGKVGMIIGDIQQTPILSRGGSILVPINLTLLGPDGRMANPGGSSIFLDAAVLIGRWTKGNRLLWELSERLTIDPVLSTRGCCEPTIAQAPDGRTLMVMRGSNDVIPDRPGVKWFSTSQDEGRAWTRPEAWTYADGGTLFSPSSSSQLFRHSGGALYWLGNATPENPRGSYPRYPMVIGEVDPVSLRPVRGSVSLVDTWQPEDGPVPVSLSSFMAHEDRRNGQIILHMSRAFGYSPSEYPTGDAYLYRLEP